MPTAEAVARYFLWLAASEPEEEPVTHMRLQKLLYYAQGWSLASRGQPLFEGEIQAWQHGPVVRELYPIFADWTGNPICKSEARAGTELLPEERNLIEWVWGRLGRYSASELRRRTHAETPWKSARGKLPEDAASAAPISIDSLRQHFQQEFRQLLREIGFNPDQYLGAVEDARAGRAIPLDQMIAEIRSAVAH